MPQNGWDNELFVDKIWQCLNVLLPTLISYCNDYYEGTYEEKFANLSFCKRAAKSTYKQYGFYSYSFEEGFCEWKV